MIFRWLIVNQNSFDDYKIIENMFKLINQIISVFVKITLLALLICQVYILISENRYSFFYIILCLHSLGFRPFDTTLLKYFIKKVGLS